MYDSTDKSDPTSACLCGSALPYSACCGLLHGAAGRALSAEQLMRSRFSAYARRDAAYLLETWDKTTRPASIDFSKEPVEWTRLEIVSLKKGALSDRQGIVEFKAYYLSNGREHVMREISRFRKIDQRWFYLDGRVKSIGKGSGKKAQRGCEAD